MRKGFKKIVLTGLALTTCISFLAIESMSVFATSAEVSVNKFDTVDPLKWFAHTVSGVTVPDVADTVEKKEGVASISISNGANEIFIYQTVENSAVVSNLGDITNKEAQYWFYISDVSKLDYIVLELSSSGACDVNEYQWLVNSVDLVNGWNQIKSKFSAATITGTPNPAQINWVRFFYSIKSVTTVAPAITKFDDLKVADSTSTPTPTPSITNAPEVTVSPSPTLTPVVIPSGLISDFETFDATKFVVVTDDPLNILSADAKVGTRSLKLVNANAVADAVSLVMVKEGTFNMNLGPNISSKKLEFWIYVSDISKMKICAVELGSAGKSDVDEAQWDIFPTLKTGWNKISLSFNDATKTGAPNFKVLNYFRIYSLGNGNGSYINYIDNVNITGMGAGTTNTETGDNGFGFLLISLAAAGVMVVLIYSKKKFSNGNLS